VAFIVQIMINKSSLSAQFRQWLQYENSIGWSVKNASYMDFGLQNVSG
jgi:hypothetical protein